MQLLRKISPATVAGGKEMALETAMKDKNKSHPLMRVIGICTGIKTGAGKEGFRDWKALTGSFEATNLLTGEIFRSGVCFLPEFAIDFVGGQLNEDVESVRFAFDIGVHYEAASATSYTYDVTPLMDAQPETDPLTALAASIAPLKAIASSAKKT